MTPEEVASNTMWGVLILVGGGLFVGALLTIIGVLLGAQLL
jgi:di/tricarboxylate transporter